MHYFVGQENEDNYGDTDEDLECTEGKDGDCLVTTNFCNGFALKTKGTCMSSKTSTIDFFQNFRRLPLRRPG